MDDVASGAVKHISTLTDVTALLGAFASADVPNANVPYIFQEDIIVTLKGTGAIALVCKALGGWSTPVPTSTVRFNRLAIEIYVDPQRDVAHNILATSAVHKQRGMEVFYTLDKHLHRVDSNVEEWGDLVTVNCVRLVEPQFLPVPDGDGELVGTAYYGVTVSGHNDVTV